MPCIKCGSHEVATTAGFCRQCSIFEQSRVYGVVTVPLQQMPERDYYIQRMPWDDYFLSICDAVKARSIDRDTQNGAVIVNEHKRVVSTGYNAFPAGVDDSFWPKDRTTKVKVPHVMLTRCRPATADKQPTYEAIPASQLEMLEYDWRQSPYHYEVDKYMAMTHAEMNAVVAAGQDLHGCCIYTLLFPCHECAKAIITSGIRRVVFMTTREDPSWAVAKELFVQAGVEMVGPEKP